MTDRELLQQVLAKISIGEKHMIADIACWERGCACHSASGNGDDGVEVQPKKEWVGLTDDEYESMAEQYVTNCYFDTLEYAKAIEAKLKGKNT